MRVRNECVDFLREMEQVFLPFVCTDSERYSHYLFDMRKVRRTHVDDCRSVDIDFASLSYIGQRLGRTRGIECIGAALRVRTPRVMAARMTG